MKFSEIVSLHDNFKKSTNLLLDKGNTVFLQNYILSLSNQDNLAKILQSIENNHAAFTFTGPYGSGKSSFALFLSELLAPSSEGYKLCLDKIKDKKVKSHTFINKTKKRVILSLVGSPISPVELIANALGCEINPEVIIDEVKKLSLINDGLVIIIDEMGKLLEQTAQKYSSLIYIFQQLAEFANSSDGKFVLIGILHQSFTEYANELNKKSQDEWYKIHGRFSDLVIDTSNEEKLDLIGKTIVTKHKPNKTDKLTEAVVSTIATNRPINQTSYLTLLRDCWPLSPIVSILLGPLSLKNFGQNQRSIFSFLSSFEAYGFQNFLNEKEFSDKVQYSIDDFWDYIKNNFDFILSRSTDAHKWSLAQEVLERAEAQSSVVNVDIVLAKSILKLVSLIEIFKGNSGLLASHSIIESFTHKATNDIEKVLEFLKTNSFIREAFDKSGYVLFDGSDFSIDSALENALLEITEIDFIQLNAIASFQPIIAKYHYHHTGVMRWMNLSIVSYKFLKEAIQNHASKFTNSLFGEFLIVLCSSNEEYRIAQVELKNRNGFEFNKKKPVVLGLTDLYEEIHHYSRELIALEWIEKNTPSLMGDRVARNEVENRKNFLIQILKKLINNSKRTIKWVDDKALGILSDKKLSKQASDYANHIFVHTPKLFTEMINNSKPSASANGALNTLLKKMIYARGKARLGISEESFSADWGLFSIILDKTKIYQQKTGDDFYSYVVPDKLDSSGLNKLWHETDEFLKNGDMFQVKQVYQFWAEAPFGIKKGLHSILLLSYLLSKEGNVAVYLKEMYQPDITELFVDYLVKESNEIHIKYVDLSDAKLAYLSKLYSVLGETEVQIKTAQVNSLHISRRLVSFMNSLNGWVHRTKGLKRDTMRFRDMVRSAKDPNKLIFEDIPSLFNIAIDKPTTKDFLSLKGAIHELSVAYEDLIHSLGNILFSALQINPMNLDVENLHKRAKNVSRATGDFRIDALASRLEKMDPESVVDIAGIASLAANKPISDWIDQDVERARIEIGALCDGFKKAELYSHLKGKNSDRITYYVLSSENGHDRQEEISVPSTFKKDVKKIKEKFNSFLKKEIINDEIDTEAIKIALLELGIEIND